MKPFKMQKKSLGGFANWLAGLSLTGRKSRERTRFVATLVEEIKLIEEGRKEIIGRFVEKEEGVEGEAGWKKVVDNEQERFDISAEKMADFNKEISEFYEEEYVLDVTEANKEKMLILADIVLNTDYAFGPEKGDSPQVRQTKITEANAYEVWCDAIEAMGIDD